MLTGEALGTIVHESKVMVVILSDILKLANGDVVFSPKGKGLILDLEKGSYRLANRFKCLYISEDLKPSICGR